MTKTGFTKIFLWATVSIAAIGQGSAAAQPVQMAKPEAEFYRLCDVACGELNSDGRHVPFYQDAYAVRALAVAHDMSGKKEYLDACRRWSDRMVAFQEKMIPGGAYYMNYGRKPGEDRGGWYSADSSSIAMAVLATSVRCPDPAEKRRYLRSVEAFARLVLDKYVRPSGGVTDGLWPDFDGEWYCSSGIFASLAFLLYDETGHKPYLKAGLGAIGWLNRLDIPKVEHISFAESAPSVWMYVLEAYSAAWPHLRAGSDLRQGALAQMAVGLAWMAQDPADGSAGSKWDYNSQWGSKFGGLPFHVYVYARHNPEGKKEIAAADRELASVSVVLGEDRPPKLSQLCVFTMFSYAEKLRAGALYRTSKEKKIR